jgi:NADPH:quinone reductase-like Zn-dependent oxidoreductase
MRTQQNESADRVEEVSVRRTAGGEVLIQVHAVSVNRKLDVLVTP